MNSMMGKISSNSYTALNGEDEAEEEEVMDTLGTEQVEVDPVTTTKTSPSILRNGLYTAKCKVRDQGPITPKSQRHALFDEARKTALFDNEETENNNSR